MFNKISNIFNLLFNIKTFFNAKKEWVYISESNDWAIYNVGIELVKFLKLKNKKARISFQPHLIFNSIIHFGSINIFYSKFDSLIFKNNKIVVTFFHGYLGMNSIMDEKIEYLIENLDRIDTIIVPNTLMHERMLELNISKKKLKIIPIPIDLDIYSLNKIKKITRDEIGLKKNIFTIGSFQKDGNGWGEGLEPKLVKGPDIFCDIIDLLSKKIELQVLLIGPSRGYVKNRLKKSNVHFSHFYLNDYREVFKYYSLIDLYLVTSREEGGPKSLLESLAANTPILTSDVGMAKDLFYKSENIVSNNDVNEFVRKSLELKNNISYKKILLMNNKTILYKNNWKSIIEKYIGLFNSYE